MKKEEIIQTIKNLKEVSKKRKFSQTFDLIINLKNFDIKKENIDVFLQLPYGKGKGSKICALVDNELSVKAKKDCDGFILKENFENYKNNKKEQKKLVRQYDFFIAQANIMSSIATVFGKVFGPQGKMPNPKAGCVVPPVIPTLEPIVAKLKKTSRLRTKNEPILKTAVGSESMDDEKVAENILAVHNLLMPLLPQEKNNIKNILLKLTMGKALEIGKKYTKEELDNLNVKKESKGKYKKKLESKKK